MNGSSNTECVTEKTKILLIHEETATKNSISPDWNWLVSYFDSLYPNHFSSTFLHLFAYFADSEWWRMMNVNI